MCYDTNLRKLFYFRNQYAIKKHEELIYFAVNVIKTTRKALSPYIYTAAYEKFYAQGPKTL